MYRGCPKPPSQQSSAGTELLGNGSLHFCVVVQCNVRQFFLDIAHYLTLGSGGEGVPTLCQDLHHVLCQVPTRQVQSKDGMWQSIPLIDGHSVRHTIARIHDNTSRSS